MKPVSIRRNTAANYAGTFFQAVLGFLFVPLYVKYLGIESYGLIGFSVSLAALLRLADLGLSSTLGREFARYSAWPDPAERMRSMLRTLQAVYWGLSLLVGLSAVAAAPFIARHWIHAGSLDVGAVQNAVALMGLTAALQGPVSLYLGGVFGLQRHVLGNTILTGLALLRFGGVVLVLALWSPTLEAFFAFQLGVAVFGALGSGIILWGLLPRSGLPARFRVSLLKSVWRFAAGMSLTAVFGLVLFQLDKIILIKMLSLEMFGYYTVAGTAAVAATYLGRPLFTTFLPRFTQLFAAGGEEPLRSAYRRSCRLNALITVPTVCCLALFSRPALLIWTRSPEIADHAHLFLSLLVIGYGLNQLALMPFALQVASGWIQLGVFTNAAAVVVIVPALVLATRFYGGVGAAAVWILLNCIYLFIYVNILHVRVLKGEAKPWYGGILVPSLIALGTGIPGRLLLASVAGVWLVLGVGFLWTVAVVATILATPDLRRVFPRWLDGPGKSSESGGGHA